MSDSSRPRRTIPVAARIALAFVTLALGFLGWRSVSALSVQDVAVHGTTLVRTDEILELARIPTDSLLLDVNAALIADRVKRHPWIREARVSRLPGGTVSIRVVERVPVLLALSADGRPSYYLDEDGYRMPWIASEAFPVPILRGFREAYHPVSRVKNPTIRALVEALDDPDSEFDALVSEFVMESDGSLSVLTTPAPAGQTVAVRLGRGQFPTRLARLRGFWDRAVLTRPDVQFETIDLRFDSQIVTRETS